MNQLKRRRTWVIGMLAGYAALALAFSAAQRAGASQVANTAGAIGPAAFTEPTYSSPIALSADKNQLWVVNPDSDTVSVIDISSANPANYQVKLPIQVGDEPQSVALDSISATTYHAYIANAAGNSVTVLNVSTSPTFSATFDREIVTGAEPWNAVASPDGKRVFVANSGQDTITVINTADRSVIGNVDLRNSVCNDPDHSRHFQPRGMAVTLANDKLFVTRFLSFTGGAAPKQATDNGKVGLVCRLNINTASTSIVDYAPAAAIPLAPEKTGFQIDSNGDGVADDTTAYPNQLQSIVIHGDRAFLPNIAASTSGPLKFNVDTQAFLSMFNGVTSASQANVPAINLHVGAKNPEVINGVAKTKLFFANPWAIAFTTPSGAGSAYVVSAGSDLLVKLNVDAANAPSFTVDADTTRYIDLHDPANPLTSGANSGKNPLGIVIRNNGAGNNFAYVMNYVSRNVSIVNLDTDSIARAPIQVSQLPLPGSQDEQLQVGKEVFFASRGVFDNGKTNRLSSDGWQNCASCHFAGLTDGNVWSFNAGPRKSVPLNGTWSPHNPDDQRVLNYSAIFDEVQDFEGNIRNVSGPGNLPAPAPANTLDPNHGLLIGDDGNINNAPGVVNAFLKPNAGRPQLTLTIQPSGTAWPALDALSEWVRFGIRSPNGALTTSELTTGGGNPAGGLNPAQVQNGRQLFFRAGCQTCHGGTKWTISSKDFVSPPAATEIFCEVNAGAAAPPGCQTAPPPGVNPVTAQFLNRFLRNINSFGFNIGGIGAIEKATDGKDALGKDHNLDGKGTGFNVPSLLSIWSLPPYYHNGGCETLACVLADANHRAPGRPSVSASDQASIVEFLKSLDAQTAFPSNLYIKRHDIFLDPPTVLKGTQVTVGANVSLFGTKADLTDLLGAGTINVRFTGPGLNAVVPVAVSDFAQDFGQARVTTTWNTPNTAGPAVISVQVDINDAIPEANEQDNIASRRVLVREPPPDTTPPVVTPGSVSISDDDPFNPADAVAVSQSVKVRFSATDAGGSGLDSFCVVRYSYNTRERRWVEEECGFRRLPPPDPGTASTFTVDATLPGKPGAAYAFVWVKDKAGNISRQPELDVISFVPINKDINIERNDVQVFRFFVNAGQTLTLRFTPSFGDIDVSAFTDLANPTRCAVSAQNGTAFEEVTLGTGACAGTSFQVEVRAVVNSRYRIAPPAALAAIQSLSPSAVAPGKDVPTDAIVAGPPARQAAIDSISDVHIPLVVR